MQRSIRQMPSEKYGQGCPRQEFCLNRWDFYYLPASLGIGKLSAICRNEYGLYPYLDLRPLTLASVAECRGMRLVSPAPTPEGALPRKWLDLFMQGIRKRGYRLDPTGMHTPMLSNEVDALATCQLHTPDLDRFTPKSTSAPVLPPDPEVFLFPE